MRPSEIDHPPNCLGDVRINGKAPAVRACLRDGCDQLLQATVIDELELAEIQAHGEPSFRSTLSRSLSISATARSSSPPSTSRTPGSSNTSRIPNPIVSSDEFVIAFSERESPHRPDCHPQPQPDPA